MTLLYALFCYVDIMINQVQLYWHKNDKTKLWKHDLSCNVEEHLKISYIWTQLTSKI